MTRRGSFIVAFASFQLLVALITEVTSVGHHFTRTSVMTAWIVIVVVALAAQWRDLVDAVRGWRSSAARAVGLLRKRAVGVDTTVAFVLLTAVFGVLVATGWLYPPSNTDSMAYHLARVAHWIQNRSVGPYAAHYLAQIELAPLAEYNLATLHLLAGTDRLDGFVQLSAAVICVVGASELARRLGASVRGQLFTALIVVSIPTLILEATSTTNNVFAAAVGVCFLVVLTSRSSTGGWLRRAAVLGIMAGLVEIAKGTLWALLGPTILVVAVAALWPHRQTVKLATLLRRAIPAGIVGVIGALCVAGPFLARNIALFGSVGGPVTRSTIVKHPTPGAMAGNVVRSASAEFLIGNGHDIESKVSAVAVGTFRRLYDLSGQNPNNRDYTLDPNPSPFHTGNFSVLSRFEDVGADPWHVVLIFITLIVLVVGAARGQSKRRQHLALALAAAAGFVIFTGVAKWSIYANRYYIPLLVVWAPVTALALRHVHRMALRALAAFLVVACTPQLFNNYSRSLLHPGYNFTSVLQPYFATSGSRQLMDARADDDMRMTAMIAHSSCHRLGLATQIVIEYPIWVGLKHFGWRGTVDDVDVTNVSRRLEIANFKPCALVAQPDQKGYVDHYAGMVASQFGTVTLFIDRQGNNR